jgi:hypothetical protein
MTIWSPERPRFIKPRTNAPVIDRRVLPNGEIEEWERPRTIPDDFIYDPEINAYYPPGEPSNWSVAEWEKEFEEEWKDVPPYEGPHLISADELRALGAFDYPPGWRTSLRCDRDQLKGGLFSEEHFAPDEPAADTADSQGTGE